MIVLSSEEKILGNYLGMVGYQKQSPSILSLRNGTTVLTNSRLIFLRSRLGETRYETLEKIEKDLLKKDSFYLNREDVNGVFYDTKVKVPYFTLSYEENGETKFASFAAPELNYDSIINLVLIFRRKLLEKDPNYSEVERNREIILIDQTHKQSDIIHQTLRSIIRSSAMDQWCKDPFYFTDSPYISEDHRKSWGQVSDLLDKTAMFISLGTKRNEFDESDIHIVKEYVKEGGVLFLSPEPKKKPPDKLTEIFGFRFGEKGIRDRKNHGLFNDHIIVTDFKDHPANDEVESIMFGDYGCYPIHLENSKGIPLAYSSKDSNPPSSIVAAEIPFGEGCVLAIGQCRLFTDMYLGEKDNVVWLKKIVDYGLSLDKTEKTTPEKKASEEITEEVIIEETKPTGNFCTNCGHKLEPEHIFCGNCGHKIS